MRWAGEIVDTIVEGRIFLGKLVLCLPSSPTVIIYIYNRILAACSSTEQHITHILSVCPDPIPAEISASVVAHKYITIDDVDYEDLLIHLPSALTRFSTVRAGVLVHCVQYLAKCSSCGYLLWVFFQNT